ncbi:MAG: hypothetical protein K6E50_02450 [Lachnospiraceae bacterium]|nr:hypothetical protein [Lachnospiraceae bacterium]
MKKKLVQLFFIILTIFSLWYLNTVFCVKSNHGIDQARAMYYQPRNSIDVVMMGSSHIHCDVDTGLLWHKYGITSYDYSAAEQPLWCTYYYLKEICKYQKPKVVVLDLFSPARFKDDYQYLWMSENLDGMRFSLNKLEMLYNSVETEKIPEYFPSFVGYHDRIRTLTPEDFTYCLTAPKDFLSYKGFSPNLRVEAQTRPELDETDSMSATVKTEDYLIRIIQFAKAHDIELFLIVTPYITTDRDEVIYNRLRSVAEVYDLHFNSTNYDYDEIGLDFDTDFSDWSHLNYWGAYKFTEYLGAELKSRYDLPDHRGTPGYESWQENYLEIAADVKERLEEKAEKEAE